ncbi:hypothetical protein J6590_041831 [Homalodisca vitripennis]|nr:hypothetical protein J6590_041831 [Homalodisca vitripennis]
MKRIVRDYGQRGILPSIDQFLGFNSVDIDRPHLLAGQHTARYANRPHLLAGQHTARYANRPHLLPAASVAGQLTGRYTNRPHLLAGQHTARYANRPHLLLVNLLVVTPTGRIFWLDNILLVTLTGRICCRSTYGSLRQQTASFGWTTYWQYRPQKYLYCHVCSHRVVYQAKRSREDLLSKRWMSASYVESEQL